MLKIKIVAVGNLKEQYLKDSIAEYSKRIKKFANFEIVEVSEYNPSSSITDSETKINEAKNILNVSDGFVVVLDSRGKDLSSEEFSDFILNKTIEGLSKITFVIGGSVGLDKSVLEKSNFLLSFGKKTYPHQLMRVMLSEQIYRALTIINHIKYHK